MVTGRFQAGEVIYTVVDPPDFANGHAARVRGERLQPGKIFSSRLVRFLRMDAGGGPNFRMRASEIKRAVHGIGTVADADREQLADAGFACVREDRRNILVVVEMAVGVDEHKGRV